MVILRLRIASEDRGGSADSQTTGGITQWWGGPSGQNIPQTVFVKQFGRDVGGEEWGCLLKGDGQLWLEVGKGRKE